MSIKLSDDDRPNHAGDIQTAIPISGWFFG